MPPRDADVPGSVAWMEGLLRERLGPGAVLGAVRFAGRMLEILGVRLPLGRGAALHLEHVVIELGAGLPLGELPLSARLVVLIGEIRALDLVVPLTFTARDYREPSFAHGALRLGAIEVLLRVLPSSWSVFGDHLAAHGALSPPGLESLIAQRLPLALGPALPADLTLTATLKARDAGGLVADLVLATARSRLTLTGTLASQLDGVRLTGRLAVADVLRLLGAGEGVVPEGALELDLTAEGSVADPAVRGRVSAGEVRLARAGTEALRIDRASLSVVADRRGVRYRDLDIQARAARCTGWGEIPLAPGAAEAGGGPLLALRVEHASAVLLAEIAAVAGVALAVAQPDAPGIPPDLTLAGEGMVTAGHAASASFSLTTPRSALLFHLVIAADGALLGSTLRGHFAAADAAHVGLVGGPPRPRPTDVVAVDGRLTGSLRKPGVAGRLGAARVSLDTGAGTVEIEDASVLLDVGPDGLAWHQLAGRFYGGHFTSSGRIGRGTGALEATVAWDGVRVEDLPLRLPGARTLAETLRGACSGELHLERRSLARHGLTASGRVTLAEPEYPFVRSIAPALERYGLPSLDARGAGPFTATVSLERGEIVVEPVAATLDGIDLEGTLHVGAGGHVLGHVRVHLLEGYLARSALLSIPAAFAGKLVIPIHVRGTPDALEVETDALEILDGLLAGSRVGDAVKSVLDGLWSAARPTRKRR